MMNFAAQMQAPVEGRRWWDWATMAACFLSIAVVVWMAVVSLLRESVPGEYEFTGSLHNPTLVNLFLLADTVAACGLVLLASVVVQLVRNESRSLHRGLFLLWAGALVTGACASIGALIVFAGNPLYWELLVLRVLRGGTVALAAAEWLLHPGAWRRML